MSQTIKIGNSSPRTEYVTALKQAWSDRTLVLFLGAGVSLPYGVPNWRDLVLELLLNTQNQFQHFWPEYRSALASWMSSYFDFNLLALSRVVKSGLVGANNSTAEPQDHFAKLVHESLYRVWKTPKYKTLRESKKRSTPLAQLARLIADAEKQGRGVAAVVTMNFDDFLEQELDRVGVKFQTVSDGSTPHGHGLTILHPHGFLPERDEIPRPPLVFSEDEYHQLTHSPYHWAVGEMSSYLRRNTSLFAGLSMTDPTLRRLLDCTAPRNPENQIERPFRRFVIRKDYSDVPNEDRQLVEDDIERMANRKRKELKKKHFKTSFQIMDAVQQMRIQARAFDELLFDDMGVGTVWINDYEDIPKVFEEIAKAIPSPQK